jgi:hypothetical protein
MAEPVFFSSDLAMKKVLPQFYAEYVNENDFSPFMGGSDYPIHVRDALGKGQGDQVFFSLLDALDPDQVSINMQQAIGTGQKQVIHADEVRINQLRITAALEGVRLTEQRTPLDLFGALRPQVLTAVQQRLRNDFLESAHLSSSTAAGSAPSVHRSLFGNTTKAKPYGQWNTKIDTALGACGDEDGMTVRHILELRAMAMLGGSPAAASAGAIGKPPLEKKLRPSKILMKSGIKEEKFVLLLSTRAFMVLSQDEEWKSYGPTRGVIESSLQPSIISGSRYRGDINGVMIYEFPELERNTYPAKGKDARDVLESLFMGAQAFGLCMAGRSDFSSEYMDHGNIYELCHIEQRGQTMLTFESSKSPGTFIENGLIHSYTSATIGD